LRAHPPQSLGGLRVVSVEDLAVGPGGLPPTDGLRYRLDGSSRGQGAARVVVRPSGTEPKLKSYLEVVVPVRNSVPDARAIAREQLDALRDDLAKVLGLN